jgi:Flp pilus assembly protein TadG
MGARAFLRRFGGDARGVAAVEMALIGAVLSAALLNAAEVGRYAWISTQVSASSQAAAHAAIAKCSPTQTPVTINCPEVNTHILTAVQGSSLGSNVTLHGAVSERWYCLTSSGALQDMSAASSRPGNCADAGEPSQAPALYIRVRTQYTYEPLFPGLTITETFAGVIVKTAWMRLR